MNPAEVKRKFVHPILLTTASVALTFFLCETAARIWLWKIASRRQIARYGTSEQVESIPSAYTRHHYLPFIPRPNYQNSRNKHNSLGFRGEEIQIPKPKGRFRIVLLGGSTTYTSGVPDYRKSYPYLLETILKRTLPSVDVVNAGCIRYSTWESLMNLEFRVLDLEPDLVVVYHGINDVHPRLVYPYEAYRGDNSGARSPYVRPEETFLDRSAALRMIRTRLGLRNTGAGLLFLRTHDYVPTNFTMEFLTQKQGEQYPSDVFLEYSAQEMLENNRPTYFRRNLENIAAICRFRGIKTLMMTFAWSNHFPKHPLVSSDEYQQAYREQNIVLNEVCKEHDIPCYDFAGEMPKDPKYWIDGRHVNELGAGIRADLVAGYLLRSGLLPDTEHISETIKTRGEIINDSPF